MTAGTLGFGLLGTGAIAAEFADALGSSERCRAAAVASRELGRAEAFGERHGVPSRYGSYDELLRDPDVGVVYVAIPHRSHAEWAVKAVQAGKPVLCEKPLTVNAAEAETVIAAAREHDAFLVEAFMYRFHPQTERLLELVRERAIGEVRAIDITFSSGSDEADVLRPLKHSAAAGGILDIGCYCVSAARQIAAAATGAAGAEPTDVVGLASLDPAERVDRYAMGILRFRGDVIAQVSCGKRLVQDDHIRVYGTRGHLHVPEPCWLPARRESASEIVVSDADGRERRVAVPGGRSIFALEADGVAELLERGPAASRPSWEDSLANMRTLDRWRHAVGVVYDWEERQ